MRVNTIVILGIAALLLSSSLPAGALDGAGGPVAGTGFFDNRGPGPGGGAGIWDGGLSPGLTLPPGWRPGPWDGGYPWWGDQWRDRWGDRWVGGWFSNCYSSCMAQGYGSTYCSQVCPV